MGKNKNNQNSGKVTPAKTQDKSVEKKPVIKAEVKKPVTATPIVKEKESVTPPLATEKKVEKKEEKKVVIPKVNAEGIEDTPTEEVKPRINPLERPTVNSLAAILGEQDVMDANHAAIFLDVFERRVSKMKPNQPLTIKMESMLDYNLAWYAIKLSVQSFAAKKELNMSIPSEEVAVQDFIDTFSSMGVALEQHVDPKDPKQTILTFKEENIAEETKVAAAAENANDTSVSKSAKARNITEEELDPLNWKSDEEAIKALRHDITVSGESPANKFMRLLRKVRLYRQNQESDPVKKSTWDTVSLGFLTKDLITLLDKNATIVLNGIVSASVTSLKVDGNMIFAHANIHKNMPALSDKEITDLIKAFIDIKHSDPTQPIDEDLAVKNGIIAPTRDLFMRIATLKPGEKENIDSFKKALNPLYQAYKDEIGSKTLENGETNPDFNLKAANKMIEIRNHYVDKEAAYPLFTAEDWKAVV